MGIPLSRVSSCANSVALSSIMSPTCHNTLARSAGGKSRQTPRSNDLRAASTARSTSSAPASATLASRSPVAGSRVSKVLPLAASTHFPPMKSFLGWLLRKVATSRSSAMAMAASYALAGSAPIP